MMKNNFLITAPIQKSRNQFNAKRLLIATKSDFTNRFQVPSAKPPNLNVSIYPLPLPSTIF